MSTSPKIHPTLAAILEAHELSAVAAAAQPEIKIIVQQKPVAGIVAAAVASNLPVRQQYDTLLQGYASQATSAAIRALAARPDVEMVWLDETVHVTLNDSVPLIGAPQVWSAGFTGKGVRVGIVDTGIDPNHPDFAGRIALNHDFTGEGAVDNHGHGTHVAGIVGGTGAHSGGKYRGVAYESSYLICKALKHDGNGLMSDVIAGVELAVEQNARVVNLSLAGAGSSDGTDALSVACDNAVDQGVVICCAAGNAGPNPNTIGFPSGSKKAITIGATDKQDHIANYSSRGPTSDGRVKPDLCFPGSAIVSCRAQGTTLGNPVDNFYTTAWGTSMATPHATGTCALLLQANPNLTPQQVKGTLTTTAKNLGLDANTQGAGRGNAWAALQSIAPASITNVAFTPATLDAGQILNVSITVRNNSPATLPTQGPNPGFVYDEGDTFATRGFIETTGTFRVGIDFAGSAGVDHPYRWGLGAPLPPGQTRTINGAIRLKNSQTKDYWAGLVREQIAWLQDQVGRQTISVKPAPVITQVTFAPTTLDGVQVMNVNITVRNDSASTLATEAPPPGFTYEEGETFVSKGFAAVANAYRVGVDFEGRGGIDHPYRWGLGAPLAPGQTTVVNGAIHLKNVQSRNYWAGFVREYVAWLQDNQGTQKITVNATATPGPGSNQPTITAVTFSPATVAAGQLLQVSITVKNNSSAALPTQGPDPGLTFAEGEDFATKGNPPVSGAIRVGVDFDGRSGYDHPYRWGLGAPLAPGQSVVVDGFIRLNQQSAARNFWVGLVQEQIAWLEDHLGTIAITVGP